MADPHITFDDDVFLACQLNCVVCTRLPLHFEDKFINLISLQCMCNVVLK
mgnify:CR=1 FL=1